MTREELRKIANAPGFGTGRAAMDRLASEAECRALLPDPEWIPPVEARNDYGDDGILMATFGRSGDDGKDWAMFHKGGDCNLWAFGTDARDDARTVAAIINAYRLGILRVSE